MTRELYIDTTSEMILDTPNDSKDEAEQHLLELTSGERT